MIISMATPVMMSCMAAPAMIFYTAVMTVVPLSPRAITLSSANTLNSADTLNMAITVDGVLSLY